MTRLEFIRKFKKVPSTSPEATLLGTFLVVITIGAMLLASPHARKFGAPELSVLNAVFTAVSATCVTGLSVVDIANQFSIFGQVIILSLIQLGGIGIMTFATFFAIILGKHLSCKSENIINGTIGGSETISLKALLIRTVSLAISVEAIGAVILALRFKAIGLDWGNAVWHGVFHAVSAFCNAGFALQSDSLISLCGDVTLLLTICMLVIIGSLGFVVISEILQLRPQNRKKVRRSHLSIHSVLIIRMAIILGIAGFFTFLIPEWDNALNGLSIMKKITISAFQAFASRTSGFTAVNMTDTHFSTQFATMLGMFIGGAPGSAAGGLKTTTAAVLILTTIAIIRNKNATIFKNRTIPGAVIRSAIAVFMLSAFFNVLVIGLLLVTEQTTASNLPIVIIFESISALSTTGLSLNETPMLSTPGRIIVIAAMYIGRVGPLAVALSIGRSRHIPTTIKYPEEGVIVG